MEVILDDRVGEGKDLKNMVRDRISNHGVMKDPRHPWTAVTWIKCH